ncbi:adenylosuccinate lyase [Salipiger abyssi]|uniref:adenylosuccinate lyase n=1 Tax=Salipiger abyssi TaxID=1250539 RepID=UPI001A8D9D70|nr:adenylosuccinate lyase [Salipiger abyssi]MBN9889622.1 adenylosuccinate lyase [Salipiger abyssi]
MTIKTLLTATALVLAPLAAGAACTGHEEVKISCSSGMVLDTATGTCKLVSG